MQHKQHKTPNPRQPRHTRTLRWGQWGIAGVFGLCLAWPTQAATPARKAVPRAEPAAAVNGADAKTAGFTIAPVPAWVVPVEAPAAADPQLPRAGLQVLLYDTQVRLEGSGPGSKVSRFARSVRQIQESGGLETASQLSIEFDPSYQTLVLHHVEVWRGGQRIQKLDRSRVKLLQRETQLERQIVDGRTTAALVLDDLRVGDRLEWAYTVQGVNPVFGDKFVDVDWSLSSKGPTTLSTFRLLAPEQRAIQVQAAPDRHEVTQQVKQGWRETWVRRRAATVPPMDPNAPASVWIPDQILVSEFKDWADVATWAESQFVAATANAVQSPAVQAQLAALRSPGQSEEALVLRVLDFVQTQVRYFGTEIGPFSHRPASPDTVLQQRFGDCKDKTTLLVTLLRAAGIEARPLLVSTAYRDAVQGQLATPLLFDHAIAEVRLGEQRWALDATRSQQRGPLAERRVTGLGWVLPVQAGVQALEALPYLPRETLRVEAQDVIRFESLGAPPSLEAQITYHGEAAEGIRSLQGSANVADLERYVLSDYSRFYPGWQVQGGAQIDEVPDHNAIRLSFKGPLSRFLQFPQERSLQADLANPLVVQALRLPDQTPRKLPLALSMPGQYRQSVRMEYPENVNERSTTQRFDEVQRHFEVHQRNETQPRSAVMNTELVVLSSQLPAADWAAHRDSLAKVWPRLFPSVTIPAINTAQADKLRAQLQGLEDSLRRGRLRARTETQVQAHVKLAVTEAQLTSGRLNPAQRAQVLLTRARQQDFLGQADQAKTLLEEAEKLAPESAEVQATWAENALIRRQSDEALQRADRALRLDPADQGPRYTRAYAHYQAERWQDTRDTMAELMKDSTQLERGYAPLWWWLASQRMGDKAAAMPPVPAHLSHSSGSAAPSWPWPVLQMLGGQMSWEDADKVARASKDQSAGQLCELWFYRGQQLLLEGKRDEARRAFERAIGTGVSEFNEYAWAQWELERLR